MRAGPNGAIVFGGGSTSVVSAPESPPRAAQATASWPRPTSAIIQEAPSFLPDGRHVLFHMNSPGLPPDKMGYYCVTTIDPGTGSNEGWLPRRPQASTRRPDSLLFVRRAALSCCATVRSGRPLELTGEPTPVAERAESGSLQRRPGILRIRHRHPGLRDWSRARGKARSSPGSIDQGERRLEPLGQPVTYRRRPLARSKACGRASPTMPGPAATCG